MKKYWSKTKKRIEKFWKQNDFFISRFRDLKSKWLNYCMINGNIIEEEQLTVSSFPHILPKWTYPELSYLPNNIWLVSWIEEHRKFDSIINKIKKDIWLYHLIDLIKKWEEIIYLIKKYKDG